MKILGGRRFQRAKYLSTGPRKLRLNDALSAEKRDLLSGRLEGEEEEERSPRHSRRPPSVLAPRARAHRKNLCRSGTGFALPLTPMMTRHRVIVLWKVIISNIRESCPIGNYTFQKVYL